MGLYHSRSNVFDAGISHESRFLFAASVGRVGNGIPQTKVERTRGGLRPVAAEITVIIPTVGRPILQRCLQSIADGTVLPTRIIVVDQGDNPAVIAWLKDLGTTAPEICHLPSDERSPASARNRAIEEVKTRFAVAIDDDCIAADDWLEKMQLHLHLNPSALVTGRLEPAGEGIPPTIVTSAVPSVYTRPSVRIHSPLSTANMGFALQLAKKIGPFDANVSPAEDNDWAYRALCAAIPIIYVPEILVYHVHWRDKAQLAATYRAYAWSQGAFYGKHLRHGDWSMTLRFAISLFRGGRTLIRGLVEEDYARRINGFSRLRWLLPGMVAGWRGAGST